MQFQIKKKNIRTYTVEVSDDIEDLLQDAISSEEEYGNYQGESHLRQFTVSVELECYRNDYSMDEDEFECERID